MNEANKVNDEKIKELETNKDNELLKNIEEKDNEILKLKNELQELAEKIKSKNEEVLMLQNQTQELNEEMEKLRNSMEESQRDLESLRKVAANETIKKTEEITSLKSDLDKIKEEISQKNRQLEFNAKTLMENENKLKTFELQTLENMKLKKTWEESLKKIPISKKISDGGIQYSMFEQGNKMLFMPHSPGIYVALLLTEISGDKKHSSKSSANVVKNKINNYVFLDLKSLPSKLQKILMNFSMLVIGISKEISECSATEGNMYKLEKGQKYYQCTLEKLENIVGFEADEPLLTNYEFLH